MSEAIERSEGLDTSLGHGVVATRDFIERYVVVESDHPLLPKESPVGRSKYGTLIVSESLPTKPEQHKPELPIQSEAARDFVKAEQEPPRQLTYRQAQEQIVEDITRDRAA